MNNMNYMIQNKNFNDIIVIDNMNNNLKNQMNIQENFGLIPTFIERKDNLENYDGEYLSGGDVPYEEKKDFDEICDKYGIELISMIAPTSEDRIQMIAKEAKGYIYIVSSLGVTGERSNISTDIGSMVKLVKENTSVPCAVGFGISNPEQARAMAGLSDGAIVGSAIVKIIAKEGNQAPLKVGEFVKTMADSVHKA